jgi:tetratricopeptide (TPR) repeat protein
MHLTRIGVCSLALSMLLVAPIPATARTGDEAQCRRYMEDGAIAACDRLISGTRKGAKVQSLWYLLRCAARNHRGDSRTALGDCDDAVRRDPGSYGAYETRCWVRNTIGEYDKAIADCTKSIALNAKFNRAYVGRCAAYAHRGEFDKAEPDCNEAIRLQPRWAPAFGTRCLLRLKRKELEPAIADCSEAVNLDPKLHWAYLNRCEARNLKNEPDSAITDCTEALKLAPRSAVGLNLRCWAYNLKRDTSAAIRDCDEAIRVNDRYAGAYNTRASAFRLIGDNERAIADYTRSIALDPRLHYPYVNRGLIYEQQGKLDAALSDFRALLQIDQDKEAARARVERLEKKIASHSAGLAAPASKRVALVIGNSAYQKVARLNNAHNDAEAVAAALRKVGFATVQMRQDLPREQFVDTLKRFAEQAAGAEWAVIYYAGHGIEVNGINYLIPTNATLASDSQVPFEAIPLDHLLLSVEGASKLRLVMLDACRENPFLAGMKRNNLTRTVGRGLAKVEPDSATLVVYAAKAGAVAQDGKGPNGPFAEAFVKHVDTPGLEINLLFRKVRDEVLRSTERRQEPYVYGSLSAEEFYFRAR